MVSVGVLAGDLLKREKYHDFREALKKITSGLFVGNEQPTDNNRETLLNLGRC
jgi:hypothetical protein